VEHVNKRSQPLVIMAAALLVLSVGAWPLFYLVLQSYVPLWPGVMCIYGVTQVGANSHGISRILPALLNWLQILKPAVVFSGGCWLTLYLAGQRSPSMRVQIVRVVLAFAVLSLVDATLECAYLAIPKADPSLAAGCCVGLRSQAVSLFPDGMNWGWLAVTYCALNGGLGTVLQVQRYVVRQGWLPLVVLAAAASIPVNLLFFTHFAAPTILGLPYHHCGYDLFARAPETVVGVGLFLAASFAVGWAGVLAWLSRHEFRRHEDAHSFTQQSVGKLLYGGSIGYLSSMILFSVELVLR
jgi:hypothetical protein